MKLKIVRDFEFFRKLLMSVRVWFLFQKNFYFSDCKFLKNFGKGYNLYVSKDMIICPIWGRNLQNLFTMFVPSVCN